MYAQHFGLDRALFEGGIAREEDVFLGPRQQLVIANIKIALTTRDSIATLVGSAGVGKTTLASRALRMAATRLALAWVGSAPVNADELLELLLAEFDFTPYGMGKVERLQTWRQFMTELSVTDTRLCILVEDAQAIGVEALRALGPLTAADPNGCPGANLVIMGQAGLYEYFENPALSQLKQRIRSRQRLDPLSVAEVEAYLRCRTTAAGGDYEKIFATGVGAALHCYTAGIPRVIDNVCETALSLAAARRVAQLTPADLMLVAERVYGLTPSGPVPAAAEETTQPASQGAASVAAPETNTAPITQASAAATASGPTEAEAPSQPAEPVPSPAFAASDRADEPEEDADPIANAAAADDNDDPAEGDPAEDDRAEASLPADEPERAPEVDADEAPSLPPLLTDVVAEEEIPQQELVAEGIVPEELEEEEISGEAPAYEPVTEAKPQVDLQSTLAEAKSLEDISNSMAEALFGGGEMEMLAAALDAEKPDAPSREHSGTGLSAEETSAVLQLSEDALELAAESEEAPEPDSVSAPPAIEAAS